MEDIRVMQFRLGSETYSIPADEVSAVWQNNRMNKWPPRDLRGSGESTEQNNRLMQVLDSQALLASRDGMTTIILHVNGMQVALAVDEIIDEVYLDKNSIHTSIIVPLIIWKLGAQKWIVSLSHKSSYIN